LPSVYLTYTHSNGDTDNKAAYITNQKTGARKYHKLDHESMDVRLYGNTAVLTATAQVETSQKGGSAAPAHLRGFGHKIATRFLNRAAETAPHRQAHSGKGRF
jgi:hypothetical protein